MLKKEIDQLLDLEAKLESKLAKEKVRVQNISIQALQNAKDLAQTLQANADKVLKIEQDNYTKDAKNNCLKLQEKAQKEIKIIESCYDDLPKLAKKTINELLGELSR